jgi:two-component system nitrogen regulation response regulator GlnG
MPRLFIIDDRDRTVEMCHRHLPEFDYVTRCDRRIPCQVCEQRDKACALKCAHDHAEAAATLAALPALPDLVVLDLHFALPEARLLPEDKSGLPAEPRARAAALEELRRTQGLLILARLRRDYPTLPVVMLTTTEGDFGARPRDPRVYFCENEVVDSRSLAAEITRALELHHTAQEGDVYWGRSRAMAELRRSLEVLARSPLPVLLEGETGTGKSYLAEHVIHPRSAAKGPFVVTDLSTIPAAILPAHLFGSRRGAFTGAVEDHAGVFEQAHGGTLLLDEIANLDLDLQRQLLLVLERGQVTRLGDTKPRPALCKLVAATNQDLAALVAAGRFRADLYMRLNPATRLRIPALRERREDLPDLVRFAFLEALRSDALQPLVRAYLARFPTPEDFREEQNRVTFGRPQAQDARRDAFSVFVSRQALGWMVAHGWPGNLRELKLCVINALVFTLTQQLDLTPASERAPAVLAIPDHILDRLLAGSPGPREPLAAAPRAVDPGQNGGRRVEVEVRPGPSFSKISIAVERQYMEALFRAHGGDLDRVATELLGPKGSARQVHLRLNQLGLKLRELRRGTT